MKRAIYLVLAVLLAAGLCGCGGDGVRYTVTKGDVRYTVDTGEHTVSDGTGEVHYSLTGNSDAYDLKIDYPDGSSWWWSKNGELEEGGQSGGYAAAGAMSGEALREALVESVPDPAAPGNIFLVILFLGFGVFELAAPKAAWRLQYGWRASEEGPSRKALQINRAIGVLLILIGVILLLL